MKITSLTNQKVKYYVRLKDKKFRDVENMFLVEGDHLVNEAINKGYAREIISLNEFDSNLPVVLVTEEIMKKISSQKSISPICAVCRKIPTNKIGETVIALDDIQDPGNLGTIIRSSVAFGIDTILLGDKSVDLYNEKVIRSSEGMIFKKNVLRCNLHDKLLELKKSGYEIIGTDLKNGTNVKAFNFPKKVVIVMGNEGNGLSDLVNEVCDNYIYIDMNNECESLNVAVASSIILYEMRK